MAEKLYKKRTRQYPAWIPYLFIAPFFIGFAFFNGAPVLYSFYISLTKWSGFDLPEFVGLNNYKMLIKDELFYTALRNTAQIILIFIPLMILFGLIISYLLYSSYVKRESLFQNIFFLPYITIPVAVGAIFQAMLNWQYGLANKMLLGLNLIREPINWLNEPKYTAWIIGLMITWQSVGYCVIMITAGFRGISREVFESARVDGAGNARTFFNIALPLLKPVLVFLIITSMIWGFQIFDETVILYSPKGGVPSGGPSYSALTLVSYLYISAFTDQYTGYGASIGYALSVIIIGCTLVMRRILEGRKGAEE